MVKCSAMFNFGKTKDLSLSNINEEKLKKMVEELDRTSKLLVRRDLELTQTNAELDSKYKELEAEKEKVESIFRNLTDGLIFFNNTGEVIKVNSRAKKFFNVKSEGIGNFYEKLRNIKYKMLKEILINRESKKAEQINFNKLVLQVATVEVVDSVKKPIGYMKILHDITREKEIDAMKSEFISIAAHQLRTPLTAIKWAMKMILDGDAGELNSEQQDILLKGYNSNERIIKLINDLLNVSRIEEGKFGLVFKKDSFSALLDEAVKSEENLATMRNISLIFKKGKELPCVYMDKNKMGIVLSNILDNSIKYTRKFGKIEVVAFVSEGNVKVSIKDNGVGIPKEEQKRLFSKFFRGSNVMRMQTEGTGLGLFIMKNIVEQHNGKIKIKSEEGKGTDVLIELPIEGGP